VGVTCTSDPSDKTNIIKAGGFDLFPQRLFTVGRLDKDSTGLILLTSDGRVNNALLSPSVRKEKVCLYVCTFSLVSISTGYQHVCSFRISRKQAFSY
jgi:pseudouridine synthase